MKPHHKPLRVSGLVYHPNWSSVMINKFNKCVAYLRVKDVERISIMRVIVVFETNYGNTRRVAEEIREGMKEVSGVEVVLKELKEVDVRDIANFDMILIGSPNHMGGPTRGIKAFIDELGRLRLEGVMYAAFDTYMGGDREKAVRKIVERVSKRAPWLKQVAGGLSVRVQGLRGPVAEGELPKCREFGRSIAAQLKRG
ncbi:MAG: flavodoxin domain-containing protein [Desulfurococcaceae archaeon]